MSDEVEKLRQAVASSISSVKSDAMESALASMSNQIDSAVIERALRAIESHSITPDSIKNALELVNNTVNLSSYQASFNNAFNSVAEINDQLSRMRQKPNFSRTQFISPSGISKHDEIDQLKDEVNQLKSEIESLTKKAQLSAVSMEELRRRQEIDYILHRVHKKTHAQISGSAELIEKLIPKSKSTKAFLLSIDIRRSTDLMLNAKDAGKFAKFLDELSGGIASIVQEHFGIFDKFTGDGALAFFPHSYSGESAPLNVLAAAANAHTFFEAHYKAFRCSFNSVLVETGLGIGIDYGDVNILRLSDGLTAVGKPVVYACRFSSADAGTTLVNQGAFEMMRTADDALEFDEIYFDIKHQGKHLAYRPKNSPRSELIKEPEWFSASPAPTE